MIKEMLGDEMLDNIAGGYDYTMNHCEFIKDMAGNVLRMEWSLVNRQTGGTESYAGSFRDILLQLNDANKNAGQKMVRLFNGKTNEVWVSNGKKMQWLVA